MCEFVKKVIVPVGAAGILAVLFSSLCVENGQCDYLKLWLFVFNLLIGGVIGGVILAGRLFMAGSYLMKIIAISIFRLVKVKTV